MSKSGPVKPSSAPARSPRRKDYFVWIAAAIFVLVAIRSLLSPKPLRPSSFNLDQFRQLSDKDKQDLMLRLWTLDDVGITSVIYLDSDSLVRRNFDELWSLPFGFAAVPDVYEDERGYSLAFSTSMMLLRTSSAIHNDILGKLSMTGRTYPVGLQEYLNEYFAVQVVKLPYIYNANLVIKQRSPTFWSALTNHIRIVRYTTARPISRRREDELLKASGRKKWDGGRWHGERRLESWRIGADDHGETQLSRY
ncbi:hypothetical protein ACEPAI_6405 [Sanghuangporus weigelae]